MITNKKNKLFVLSGASGSGKSSLLSKIVNENLCVQVSKYSSREQRATIFDDITHIQMEALKKKCDITYERYDTLYGINTKEIKEKLPNNNLIVIISDISSIEKIKRNLGDEALIVFIYLHDLCIDYLSKERYKLKLSNEEKIEFANYIIYCRKNVNENWIDDAPENIRNIINKISDGFSNDKIYHEFIKRCYSWIELEIEYRRNKNLFMNIISGVTIEELFDKFVKQIFREYTY